MIEITENTKTAGTVYYDGTCSMCIGWMDRLGGLLERHGFGAAPLIDGGNADEMKVVARDGREFGGADAIVDVKAIP